MWSSEARGALSRRRSSARIDGAHLGHQSVAALQGDRQSLAGVLHEVANGHVQGSSRCRFGQQLQHSLSLQAQSVVCPLHEREEPAAASQRPVLVMAVLGRLNIICRRKASV